MCVLQEQQQQRRAPIVPVLSKRQQQQMQVVPVMWKGMMLRVLLGEKLQETDHSIFCFVCRLV
jgi:hypothetical protein